MKKLKYSEKRKRLLEKKKNKKAQKGIPVKGPSDEEINRLLQYAQTGWHDEAKVLALSVTERFPKHPIGWKVLGFLFAKEGEKTNALNACQKAVELDPQDANAHCNLGLAYREVGRLEKAESSYRQAIKLQRDSVEAHYNLGNSLRELSKLEEAEASYRQALALKPDYAEAYNNLGFTLQKQERFEEAEASYRQAIVLKSDSSQPHCNLGYALIQLGRFEEAEASLRQAILLKSDFPEAFSGLGIALKQQGRLDEAEVSLRQSIAAKPDYAEAYYNLGIVLYGNGDMDSALTSIERANFIEPKSKDYSLLMSILQKRKMRKTSEVSVGDRKISDSNLELPHRILKLDRPVEDELLTCLYELNSVNLEKEKDPSFGNTRGSLYQLFQDAHDNPLIKSLAEDLESILCRTLKSDIFIDESFFSIFGSGGGTKIHNHIILRDEDVILRLANQKYSLVYYLSVGDQDCSEPGILKFYEPSEDILPAKGLITIFPSDRYHSSIYGGNKDRVIIGVNFYCL